MKIPDEGVVMLCPECGGKGGRWSSEPDGTNNPNFYNCGLCKGERFVLVNPEKLVKIP